MCHPKIVGRVARGCIKSNLRVIQIQDSPQGKPPLLYMQQAHYTTVPLATLQSLPPNQKNSVGLKNLWEMQAYPS